MTKHLVRALAIALFVFAADARAASPRVYLASSGANSGACTRAAPCLTFAYALAQVSPKGEIVVLDTSSYAPFTVTKSVSIVAAPGAHVVVSAVSGTAVTVTIAVADAVVLRGLTVMGQGAGNTGVRFNGQGALHIEECVVSGFTAHGIFQSGSGRMYVKDTQVRDGGGYGIRMYVNSGRITGSIDHCRVENIGNDGTGIGVGNNAEVSVSNTVVAGNGSSGFVVGGSGMMTVSDSTAEGNDDHGFYATSGGRMALTHCRAASNFGNGAFVDAGMMTIDNSVFSGSHNGGIVAGGASAFIVVANSTVFNNINGVSASSGKIISRGNNTVIGNANTDIYNVTYSTDPH